MRSPLGSWWRITPVVLLLAAAALTLRARDRAEILPAHEDLAAFPMQVGGWLGTPLTLTQSQLDVLGPGEFLLRDYRRSAVEPPVNLYIAFFPSQRTGDTIHSPKNCLPGAGWTPIKSSHMDIRRDNGSDISVNRYIIAQATNRSLVLYWYQAHGRVTASEYWAKFYLVADAMRMNRTDGALLRIVTPLLSGESEQSAQTRAVAFTHRVLPLLDRFIPR